MKKSEKTKKRIIESGTILFARHGFSNSSTKDIALLAEISEATIFKYYKSKDGLFKAILFSLLEELKKISVTNIGSIISANYGLQPLYHILSDIVDNRIIFLDQHDSIIKAILQEALINPELKEQVQLKVWPEISQTLCPLFEEAISSGEIQPKDTNYLISSFLSAIVAPIIASYIVPNYDKEIRATYIKQNFELFYRSLRNPQKETLNE